MRISFSLVVWRQGISTHAQQGDVSALLALLVSPVMAEDSTTRAPALKDLRETLQDIEKMQVEGEEALLAGGLALAPN